MGTTLNKETYEKLIAADLDTLSQLPHSLEKDHIRSVLNDSVDFYYQPRESQKADTGESNCYAADCLIQDACKSFKTERCNKECKLYA